jgi:hypothetical protein
MRYLILFPITLLFITSQLVAQDEKAAEINWGKEHREPSGTFLSEIIPFGTNTFYGLREKIAKGMESNKEKIYIERYNEKMNIVKSKELVLKYKNKNLEYEGFIKVGGELYLLTSFNNQAKKKNYLFAQRVSKKSLTVSDKLVKIGEIDTRNIEQEGYFDHHISRDSSKILIYNALPYKKGMPERFALHVFDNQFNELWTKDIALPYDDKYFSVEEYQVDNEGNVYIMGLNYKPEYFFTILEYSKDGADFQEYPIKPKEKLITDLTFRVDDDGNLVCSGFYSDYHLDNIQGTYFFRLDTKTNEVLNKSFKEFDFSFRSENLSSKQLEKARRSKGSRQKIGLNSYSLDKLILRSDGGALLIAEQYFVEEYRRSYDNSFYSPGYYPNSYSNSYSTEYYYHYNDIIVVNIQPNGDIEWAARIPKQQTSVNDDGYYLSYSVSIVKDKIYFIYNDSEDNFDQNERNNQTHEFKGGSKRSLIAVAEISRDGSVVIFPLFKNRDADIITRPKICKQVDKKNMIIYGEKGKTYRFGNVEFRKKV